MAVLRHFSIKNSPLATLKYITGETKAQKAAIVTGINCSDDPESAYIEMKMCYEHYAGEKFHRTSKPVGKEHLKMHHYVISFKGQEVTPEEADRIAQEWAKSVFGDDFQILIATHTDTKNIHVHVAVNAFDMNGKRWLDNKSTVKLCREKINDICRKKRLDIIEHPKWSTTQNYAEWLERQNGTSWKQKLCDDIDRIVIMENVRSIEDLIAELVKLGYEVRSGKYLSVKPAKLKNRKAVRTLRLGDGYGLEELQYRIENKNREMSFDKILTYSGVQREYALCLRQIQIMLYRKPEEDHRVTYREVLKTCELLNYIHDHNIHSKQDFETHVNKIAEQTDEIVARYKSIQKRIAESEYRLENGDKFLELYSSDPSAAFNRASLYKPFFEKNIKSKDDLAKISKKLEVLKREHSGMQSEYDNAVAAKKAVTAHYTTFLRQIDNDYAGYLYSAKKELADYEASLNKQPKKEFKEVVRQMADWAEKVNAKIEEKKRVEEQERAARRKRDSYYR